MQTNFVRIVLSALTLTLFAACSTDTERCDAVDQTRIYQAYSATYDQVADKTTATAKFTFGDSTGTTLEMVGNCKILHDSFTMSESLFSGLFGTSYDGSKSGFTTNHTFTFTDNDSKSFVNTGTIASTDFSSPPTTFSKAALPVNVSFTPVLAADEVIYLTFAATSGDTMYSYTTSTSTVGASTITVAALADIPNGAATIQLRRSRSFAIQQAAAVGGSVTMTYETSKTNVTIAP